jgi:hypothetical protein
MTTTMPSSAVSSQAAGLFCGVFSVEQLPWMAFPALAEGRACEKFCNVGQIAALNNVDTGGHALADDDGRIGRSRMDIETRAAIDAVRGDLRDVESSLRAEIREVQSSLRAELGDVETRLSAELGEVETRFRVELGETETRLRTEFRHEIREEGSTTRRHFDVVAESLRDDIRIIAEGLITLDAKVEAMRRG